jgi:hypothetical protein
MQLEQHRWSFHAVRGRTGAHRSGRGGAAVAGRSAPMIFPVSEQPTFRPVNGRPPGLLAATGPAPNLDVAPARGPRGRAVAWLPGDGHRAGLPRVVQAAFRRPGSAGHPASRTQFRRAWPADRRRCAATQTHVADSPEGSISAGRRLPSKRPGAGSQDRRQGTRPLVKLCVGVGDVGALIVMSA